MAKGPEAYVDTSAFIAFVDRSDSFHVLFRRLFAKPPKLFSSSLVIAEGHAWFLRRYDQQRALQFLAFVEDLKPLSVVSTGATEVAAASQLLRKFADQNMTLTDAVGLVLMRERKTVACWSTDRHLGLTGVPLVLGRS